MLPTKNGSIKKAAIGCLLRSVLMSASDPSLTPLIIAQLSNLAENHAIRPTLRLGSPGSSGSTFKVTVITHGTDVNKNKLESLKYSL